MKTIFFSLTVVSMLDLVLLLFWNVLYFVVVLTCGAVLTHLVLAQVGVMVLCHITNIHGLQQMPTLELLFLVI